MNAKKILAFIASSAIMCTALASCGDKDNKKDTKSTSQAEQTSTAAAEPETEAETVQANTDAVISDNSIDVLAKPIEGESAVSDENAEPAPEFDGSVAADTGTAFLALNTDDWWVPGSGAISLRTRSHSKKLPIGTYAVPTEILIFIAVVILQPSSQRVSASQNRKIRRSCTAFCCRLRKEVCSPYRLSAAVPFQHSRHA